MANGKKSNSGHDKPSVLFCCLGNICRSPMAEAVFEHMVTTAGIRDQFNLVESCGTGAYHEGEEPDERTVAVLKSKKIPCTSLARAVTREDFSKFDYIFGMDTNNVRNLRNMQPKGTKARVEIFGVFDDGKPINDPYYGIGGSGFQSTYEQCARYSKAFLNHLGHELTTSQL